MDTKKFIERVNKQFNNAYDYTKHLKKQIKLTDKIVIICPKHDEWLCSAHDHLYNKSKCPACYHETMLDKNFIDRATNRFGKFYDYSQVAYLNANTKVKIICPKHGEFKQDPAVHLRSKIGCPKCKVSKRTSNNQNFIDRANKLHNKYYDYSTADYKNSHEKVSIICPIHGEFFQTPSNHLYNNAGCKKCANINKQGTYNSGRKTAKLFNNEKEGFIYIAEFNNENETFLKVGITTRNGVKTRYGQTHKGYEINPLYEHKLNIIKANEIEQHIFKIFKNKSYTPQTKFGGYTECLKVDIFEEIKEAIEELL